MDDIPSFWTLIPGFTVGCLFIGRFARWLEFVRATMGKPGVSFEPEKNPRPWKTTLAILAYPTPWITLGLAIWAVHHFLVSPFTNEWRWFYVGFFGGPPLLLALILRKARKLRRSRQSQSVPPP